MELSSSDKERIQHQYDALAKKTLVGEAKSHRRTLAVNKELLQGMLRGDPPAMIS